MAKKTAFFPKVNLKYTIIPYICNLFLQFLHLVKPLI